MKQILGVLAAVAAALLLLAWIVFGVDDRSVTVPSPNAAAEGFLRSLASERYDVAMGYLDSSLEQRSSPEELKAIWEQVKSRAGRIGNISGEEETIGEERATAVMSLETSDAGPMPMTLSLHREHGVWKIADLEGIKGRE